MPRKKTTKAPAAKATSNGDGRPTLNQLIVQATGLMANAQFSRGSLARLGVGDDFDPRRSINEDCGYPATEHIRDIDYKNMYVRNPIANRVVQILPMESWQVQPGIVEDEDPDNTTPFEARWNELGDNFQGKSWRKDKENNPVLEYLQRVDQDSGIGAYGVLLLGLDDSKPLHEPVEPREGQDLTFLRVFDRSLVDIATWEQDTANPRFGKPTSYSLTFNDRLDVQETSAPMLQQGTNLVHWTRIQHVADNLGSSDIYGTPRQRPVWNRLLDCRKLYGGSAEMYWRGALPGYSIQTHPQLGPDAVIDVEASRDVIEQFINSLQRWMAIPGADVKSLAPQVVDPTAQIDVQIEAICIQGGYPKRVFTGSERGELASTQDTLRWNGRLMQRQENYITPRIIVPFVDRLIWLKVLPEPTDGYSVVWPDLSKLTAAEQADIAVKQTDAMAKFVQGEVSFGLMHPEDFLVRILGMKQAVAEEIMERAAVSESLLPPEPEPEIVTVPATGGQDEAKAK